MCLPKLLARFTKASSMSVTPIPKLQIMTCFQSTFLFILSQQLICFAKLF